MFLAIPACKDQVYRYFRNKQTTKASQSRFSGMRRFLAGQFEERRESYSGWDSLFLGIGAFGLFLSFLFKMAGN